MHVTPAHSGAMQLQANHQQSGKRLSFRTLPKALVALQHGRPHRALIDVITAASCPPNERSRGQLGILQRFLVSTSPKLAACPAWQQAEFARVAELYEFDSGQMVDRARRPSDTMRIVLRGTLEAYLVHDQPPATQVPEQPFLHRKHGYLTETYGVREPIGEGRLDGGQLQPMTLVGGKAGLLLALRGSDFRSICRGSLAMSTKVKLQQLMSVTLIASMGIEHVFCNVMHRFKSSFLDTGSVLFKQGDPILESSPVCLIANGKAKVLVDPKFTQLRQQWEHGTAQDNPPPPVAATSEAGGCRVVCWLHAGEMLGETRLMMDEDAIKAGEEPLRTATIVAEGHLVLLSMTTAEARVCLVDDRVEHIRRLAAARQDFLATRSAGTMNLPPDIAKAVEKRVKQALGGRDLRSVFPEKTTSQPGPDEQDCVGAASGKLVGINAADAHDVKLECDVALALTCLSRHFRALEISDCSKSASRCSRELHQRHTPGQQGGAKSQWSKNRHGAAQGGSGPLTLQPTQTEQQWASGVAASLAQARMPLEVGAVDESASTGLVLHSSGVGCDNVGRAAVNAVPSWQFAAHSAIRPCRMMTRSGRPRSAHTTYTWPEALLHQYRRQSELVKATQSKVVWTVPLRDDCGLSCAEETSQHHKIKAVEMIADAMQARYKLAYQHAAVQALPRCVCPSHRTTVLQQFLQRATHHCRASNEAESQPVTAAADRASDLRSTGQDVPGNDNPAHAATPVEVKPGGCDRKHSMQDKRMPGTARRSGTQDQEAAVEHNVEGVCRHIGHTCTPGFAVQMESHQMAATRSALVKLPQCSPWQRAAAGRELYPRRPSAGPEEDFCTGREGPHSWMQVGESEPDANLSAQYTNGQNARRRSRMPAAKRPQVQPDSFELVPKSVPDAAKGATEEDPSEPAQSPLSASHRHAGHCSMGRGVGYNQSFGGTMARQRSLHPARMSVRDPFQDLAERTFHRSEKPRLEKVAGENSGSARMEMHRTGVALENWTSSAGNSDAHQSTHPPIGDHKQPCQSQMECQVWNPREVEVGSVTGGVARVKAVEDHDAETKLLQRRKRQPRCHKGGHKLVLPWQQPALNVMAPARMRVDEISTVDHVRRVVDVAIAAKRHQAPPATNCKVEAPLWSQVAQIVMRNQRAGVLASESLRM
eukprot:jgi/Ulvmu1/7845/UM004_0075.1